MKEYRTKQINFRVTESEYAMHITGPGGHDKIHLPLVFYIATPRKT